MTPPSLPVAIEAFNANDLTAILYQAGVKDLPKSKDGKVRLWAQLIGDAERIRAALAKLPARPRRALELLQRAEGEVRTQRFRDLLAREGISEKKKGNPAAQWGRTDIQHGIDPDPTTFEQILASLLRHGLIWTYGLPEGAPTNMRIGFDGGRYVYIPSEIALRLPPAPPAKVRPPVEVSQVLGGSARTCQRDLYLLWSAGRDAPFRSWAMDSSKVTRPDLKPVVLTLAMLLPITSSLT